LCHLFHSRKTGKKWTKSYGYSLTFCSFFATYLILQKVAKNGRKVKAIALLSVHFLPLISFLKKWQKMDEK
jgi:hypothetical protein